MKKILIFSLLFVGLAACATASQGFGPANGSDYRVLFLKDLRGVR